MFLQRLQKFLAALWFGGACVNVIVIFFVAADKLELDIILYICLGLAALNALITLGIYLVAQRIYLRYRNPKRR
jgi:hypothetical protein